MMGNQPIIILKEGTNRERGRTAQSNNIMAARAIADAVRTTLGPRGMDKMLVDSLGDVVITNDGATILKEIDVEHPAAKMVIEVSKAQDEEVGDGTTTAVVLAGELLKNSEELIENVHPTLIVKGYRLAADKAVEILRNIAVEINTKSDKDLRIVPTTAMYSKSASTDKELLADISVRAIRAVTEPGPEGAIVADIDNIQIIKKVGGSIADTQLVEGIIVDKERVHSGMPRSVKNAKIALLNLALEVKKPEVDTTIQITDPSKLAQFLGEEENILRKMVEQVQGVGATVVFAQKGIDDLAQHFLAKAGVYAVRRVKKSDLDKLERATGGRIVSNLDDLDKQDLGKAELVEERKIGDEQMTFVTGCPKPTSVSVLIRGGTEHVVDEVERTLHDALGVTSTVVEDGGKVLAGGGAPEVEVALRLREWAPTVGGREQLAIEAFADALEVIPRTLAENAGLDSINILVDLREAHGKKGTTMGVNVFTGKVEDMRKNQVLEPLKGKIQAIRGATEVATMILRIDDVIAAKSTKGAGPPRGGAGGMPPGMGGMGGGMGDMDF
ncbi:MAG TPA: thermosome subunit beta [Candidatus Thermoplasmatota archaeon]|nr:thermosome subunit beta [Candidatus Thermoplasmatota archaeon]